MMVGLGGVWIEALHDVAMLSPDSDRQDVLRALNGLKGGSILRGWRGEPAADLEAVVDTVVQLGRIIRGNPRIEEIEINPLSVRDAGQGATVRSEERRVGKECVSTCRSRWWQYH